VLALGEAANRNKPELVSFDRYGRRLDEVAFIRATLPDGACMEHRITICLAVEVPGRHLGHAALLAIFTQVEAGTMCPIGHDYAAVPTLRAQPDATSPWLTNSSAADTTPRCGPIADKLGISLAWP